MILLKGSKNYYSIIIIILQWIDLWIYILNKFCNMNKSIQS